MKPERKAGDEVIMIERLHRLTEEQAQKCIYYGLVVLIFVLPVSHLFFPESERAIGMQATLLVFALFYFGFFIVAECLNKRFKIKEVGIPLYCLIGLSIAGVFSVLFSEDKMISIYGTVLRAEGLLSLFAYYMIFIVSTKVTNKKYRRKLLSTFLFLGVIVVFLGLIQYTGIYVFGGKFPGMAYVPMRNPNFYGAFVVLFTGVGIGGFFLYHKDAGISRLYPWWNRGVWYILVLCGYVGCICAKSSLVYVGISMMLLLYLFLTILAKRKDFWSFVILIFGLVAIIFIFDFLKNGGVTAELKSLNKQIRAEGSVFGDSVGSGRMQIWKQSVFLLRDYWLFGCGIECLGNYCHEGPKELSFVFDKAHNEYLNIWVTEGIFALIFYLLFLFALFIPGLKQFIRGKVKKQGKKGRGNYTESIAVVNDEDSRESDVVSKIVFFAFFGYIAQAFFNISVVQVAPYFWMICGLLYRRKRNENEEAMGC